MSNFSEISPSVLMQSYDGLEHPVHIGARCEVHAKAFVGRYTFLNCDTVIYSGVSIGRYCSFGRNCEIGVADHPITMLSSHNFQYSWKLFPKDPEYRKIDRKKISFLKETKIGNDVWIGAKAIVRSGVVIGDGAIIAAGAVVVKDVEPYSIVGGVPAKFIRSRFDKSISDELMKLKWWDRKLSVVSELPFDDVAACIEYLKATHD
ncbi:MAG: CatB-related O-acetyltransferase [Comamonas sp.]